MISERLMDNLRAAVERETNKNNHVLDTGVCVDGYYIRLHKGDGKQSDSIYYTGNPKKPHSAQFHDCEYYYTMSDAYETMIKDHVKPYSNDEMPQIVYVTGFFAITEREVK